MKKSWGSYSSIRQNRLQKKAIKRDPEGHFIILKGRIHQEDINIVNIYAPNIGAPKYIQKIFEDFTKDIDCNTIIVRDFNTPLSKITLNVNGLNAPIKRHRIAEWIRKHDPHIGYQQETHFRTEDLHRLKVKGWKKYSKQMAREKKAGVAIPISDEIDFKRRARKTQMVTP